MVRFLAEELVRATVDGPKASDQFAVAVAVLLAGVSARTRSNTLLRQTLEVTAWRLRIALTRAHGSESKSASASGSGSKKRYREKGKRRSDQHRDDDDDVDDEDRHVDDMDHDVGLAPADAKRRKRKRDITGDLSSDGDEQGDDGNDDDHDSDVTHHMLMTRETDEVGARNLSLLLGQLVQVGAVSPVSVGHLATRLAHRLSDADVAIIYHMISTVGWDIRRADPTVVLNLVRQISQTQAERSRQEGGMTPRATILLDAVVDLKNNLEKKKGNRRRNTEYTVPLELKKWLEECGVEHVCVEESGWVKRVVELEDGAGGVEEEEEEEGPAGGPSAASKGGRRVSREATSGGDVGVGMLDDGWVFGVDEEDVVAAAQTLRLTGGVRRSIFHTLMGSADYRDAGDRLRGLPLHKKQRGEIPSVVLECAIKEKVYNKFYLLVLTYMVAREVRAVPLVHTYR